VHASGAETTGELSSRRFIVCGDSPLAYRLVVQLTTQYESRVTAIFTGDHTIWADRIAQTAGVNVLTAKRLDAETFLLAGLADADALALVDPDDTSNVDAALLVQEIRPNVRIVIRMSSRTLGQGMAQLLNNCVTLSASAIAAPAFVAAAIGEASTAPITVADRSVVAVRFRDGGSPDSVVAPLAIMGPSGSEPDVLPADGDPRTDYFLVPAKPAPPRRRRRKQSRVRLIPILFGPRLRAVLAVFFLLFLAGTAVLSWARGISPNQAAYTALITELGGGADPNAAGVSKIVMIFLTMISVAIIPTITAAVIDSLVQTRLRLQAGGLVEPTSNHIVVVGLGNVGTRIIRALHGQGIDVVAIERDAQAPGIQTARDFGIPVIVGDASRAESLNAASIGTARALVVVSTDDVTNLETALNARQAKPDLRVVLRLFDADFADRVHRTFGIDISRSVSYLAAPAFAAAMLGRQILATIPVRRHVLLVAELPVGPNSPLELQPVAAITRTREVRLIAIRTADGQVLWRPSPGRPIRGSDTLIVVATRNGLTHLLADTVTPAQADNTPYRLLEPWGLPQARPTPAKESGDHPQSGPTTADSPPQAR
jgi:Trk K+ transport system NAD-binding subunit